MWSEVIAISNRVLLHRIECRTGSVNFTSSGQISIQIDSYGQQRRVTSSGLFSYKVHICLCVVINSSYHLHLSLTQVVTVTSISPSFGPMAGGSLVSIRGSNLNVGNQENTTVTFQQSGAQAKCDIQWVIQLKYFFLYMVHIDVSLCEHPVRNANSLLDLSWLRRLSVWLEQETWAHLH